MKWQTQMNHTELTDLASITQSPPPMIVPVYLLSQFGGAIYHLSLTSGSTNTSSDGTAKKEDQAEVQQVHAAPKTSTIQRQWRSVLDFRGLLYCSHLPQPQCDPEAVKEIQRMAFSSLSHSCQRQRGSRGNGGVWRLSSASEIVLFSIQFQSLNVFSHFVINLPKCSYICRVTCSYPSPSSV